MKVEEALEAMKNGKTVCLKDYVLGFEFYYHPSTKSIVLDTYHERTHCPNTHYNGEDLYIISEEQFLNTWKYYTNAMGEVYGEKEFELLIPEWLEKSCDERDIGLTYGYDKDNAEAMYEFSWFTSQNQEAIVTIYVKDKNDKEAVLHELYEYAWNYNAEEEADKWTTEEYDDEAGEYIKVGVNGAPHDYEDIVEDMESIKETINELYRTINK